MIQHKQYEPCAVVFDLTFDPPQRGVIVSKHEKKDDTYWVRIIGESSDVLIHARNLRSAT